MRYNNDCLLYGRYENISLEDDVLSFERKLKEQRIKVIINFSNSTYKEEAIGEILYGKTRNNKVVLLEPYEFTIISLKK
ncbi:MAG: hypothetical protein SOV85_05390 [Clostridium sp.]|uniref:hypothetical protein n=1 Tax=Clostridium sp. TaxID=1506 RepID=UPI002A74B4FC|nr:hypothetical protein [Clostridium sp.]MDY2630774.1 hypothetical protein [Clostridium sp.]